MTSEVEILYFIMLLYYCFGNGVCFEITNIFLLRELHLPSDHILLYFNPDFTFN